jgi:hypothetical protein
MDELSVTVVPAPTPSQSIGVLHDEIAASNTVGHLALSTPRRSLTTSPLPLVTTPRSPTTTFQIRRSLEFWNSTVVFKQRWRWKLVNDDDYAMADDSAGVVDGSHRMTEMIFPGGSLSSVSMNEGNLLVTVPHTWTPMPFDILTDTSFAQQRGRRRGLRPWRQFHLTSFPGASGRITFNRMELVPFLEVHVVRHFWKPLEGSRSNFWSVGLGVFGAPRGRS